jgi:hypothetical protein
MRTTIDLPDDLFRQAKVRAAMEGIKLKDLIAAYVRRGLAQPEDALLGPRQRSPLPHVPKAAATGKPIPALSNAQVQAIPDEEDAERFDRSAGR